MKKPKISKPRKVVSLPRELRYMSPENIAKDFPSRKERAAIAAVFEWLSLNGICAWEHKKRGHYTTNARFGRTLRLGTNDAIVLPDESYERARKLLVTEDS